MKSQSSNSRGQVVVIGALILVLFVLVASSLYVQQVEPKQNTNAEISHQTQFEKTMLELHSKISNSDTVNYQTFSSKVEYTTLGTRIYQDIGYKISNQIKTENLTFTNGAGDTETIETNTRAFTISKKYMYISDTSYTYEHTYVYRNTTNKKGYIVTPINIVNGNNITLQTVTVNTISQKQSFNIEIDETSSAQTKQITNGELRIETDVPVEQFQVLEEEATVTDVTRSGDVIIITLQDGEYTVIEQEVSIETANN